MIIFAYEDTYPFFERLYDELAIPKPYTDVLALLRDEVVLKHAQSELYDTVHRAALRELFELTKRYCVETNQLPPLRAQPWYQFWRILRNCFSHDMTFRFSDHDRKVLPVVWSDVKLDASYEGRPLTHGAMSRQKLQDLLEGARRFVEKGLY